MIINIYHKLPYDVYIGRAGKGNSGYLGNPIKKGELCSECSQVHEKTGDTLICYEAYARRRIKEDLQFKKTVKELYGKTLGCFCTPKNGFQGRTICHGQILEKLSEELNRGGKMKIAAGWTEILKSEFEKEYILKLTKFLNEEYSKKIIYPKKENILRALKLTDYKDVKICVIGQDPYHGPGQANGLAFAVNSENKVPPSLKNIFKEIGKDYSTPIDPTLLGWARQGVLLLNNVLTVEDGKANSHKGRGWEIFTDTIIKRLNERTDPVIFLLWGSFARTKKELIKNSIHKVLEAAHPSPLSAHNGFFGCEHFKKANLYLEEMNKDIIDWSKSGEVK